MMRHISSSLVLVAVLAAAAPGVALAHGVVVVQPPPPVYVTPVPHRPPPRGTYARGFTPTPRTWYMGMGLVGTNIVGQSGGPEQLDSGAGLSAWLGVRLADSLGLEIGWLGSFHNPASVSTWFGAETDFLVLEGVTADARLHLAPGRPFDPYLQGGVGVYFLGSEHFGLDSVGTGFQAGGGGDIWLTPAITLGVRALYRGVAMGPPDGGDNDTFVSAVTLEGALAFHF